MYLPPPDRTIQLQPRAVLYRRSQRLPIRGTRVLHIIHGSKWMLVQWKPRMGYWCLATGRYGQDGHELLHTWPRPEEPRMKRRQPVAAEGVPLIALSETSVVLGKFKSIREFVSRTAYDDNSARTPGYFTLRNRVATYEITWYDPDSGLRLPVRGTTLDDVLSLSEKLLSAEEAPWEVDRYLSEELARKSRKKKSA